MPKMRLRLENMGPGNFAVNNLYLSYWIFLRPFEGLNHTRDGGGDEGIQAVGVDT